MSAPSPVWLETHTDSVELAKAALQVRDSLAGHKCGCNVTRLVYSLCAEEFNFFTTLGGEYALPVIWNVRTNSV